MSGRAVFRGVRRRGRKTFSPEITESGEDGRPERGGEEESRGIVGVPDGGGDFLGNQSADDPGFLIDSNTFIVIHPPQPHCAFFSPKPLYLFPFSAVVLSG